MMGLAKSFLLVVLAVALGAYGFDCEAMTTPQQASQCCRSMSMHCSSHGSHGVDCCKTMRTVQPPFVRLSSVREFSASPVVLAVMPGADTSNGVHSSDLSLKSQCHALPEPPLAAARPLRV